jgi:hypothetical protein
MVILGHRNNGKNCGKTQRLKAGFGFMINSGISRMISNKKHHVT